MRARTAVAMTALILGLPATGQARDDDPGRDRHVIDVIDMPVVNECSGETVWLTGDATIEMRVSQDGDHYRVRIDDRTRASGVVEGSGARYTLDERFRSETRSDGADGTSTFAHTMRLKNTGKVKAPDYVLEAVTTVDWNETGALDHTDLRVRCK
jgi:hypothetical protein